MSEQEQMELKGEGVTIRHSLDGQLNKDQWDAVNRLIEIELLLEAESNK